MKDLLQKISSYNIFNYLLPGVLFVVLADALTNYRFAQDDLLLGACLYYFIGLIVSRVGSLLIEPLLKWIGIVRFAPYDDFVAASKKDDQLLVLSEANNMYRTLCAMLIVLAALKGYGWLLPQLPHVRPWADALLVGALLALMLFSYRKQTLYITKRVQSLQGKVEGTNE